MCSAAILSLPHLHICYSVALYSVQGPKCVMHRQAVCQLTAITSSRFFE